MESIAATARRCMGAFRQLNSSLILASADNRGLMPPEQLDLEFSRFKIWCGNLGALQIGKGSLDARLLESTVVRTNIVKLLEQLNRVLVKSNEVISGSRLPYEEQTPPKDSLSESSSSESEEAGDDEPSREVNFHRIMIQEIVSNLFKISFKIRNTSTRPHSTARIKRYTETDEETGIEKFKAYKEFDRRHIEESLRQLRREAADQMHKDPSDIVDMTEADQYLLDRLVTTMNHRRKLLRYWQKHAKKLAQVPTEIAADPEILLKAPQPEPSTKSKAPDATHTVPTLASYPERTVQFDVATTVGGSLLSKTEATPFDIRLDNAEDAKSAISYATIYDDTHGSRVKLPRPPAVASEGSEFLCPYCGVVCPKHQGRGQGWKAHILQDLRPYFCTYGDCETRNDLFGSLSAWMEHERLGHRRMWQCFQHSTLSFRSKAAIQEHFALHHDEFDRNRPGDETRIQNLINATEVSFEDTRTACPFCRSEGPFTQGFENHMAFHMRQFATFAVSSEAWNVGDEENEAEGNQSDLAQGPDSSRETLAFELPESESNSSDEVPEDVETASTSSTITPIPSSDLYDKAREPVPNTHGLLDPVTSGWRLWKTLRGHEHYVRSIAFSSDGEQIASASNDKTIRLWDSVTGKLEHILRDHEDTVSVLKYSPDGKLVSGSYDRSIKIWDSARGRCYHTLEKHCDWISALAFSKSAKDFATAAYRKEVKLWDWASGTLLATFDSYEDRITGLTFDGTFYFSSISESGNIRAWQTFGEMRPGPVHQTWPCMFRRSTVRGSLILAVSEDCRTTVKEFNTSYDHLYMFEGFRRRATACALAMKYNQKAIGSSNGTISTLR